MGLSEDIAVTFECLVAAKNRHLELLLQTDGAKVLCTMVPPLPTYAIVDVQLLMSSAGRRLGLSTSAGPGVAVSV